LRDHKQHWIIAQPEEEEEEEERFSSSYIISVEGNIPARVGTAR